MPNCLRGVLLKEFPQSGSYSKSTPRTSCKDSSSFEILNLLLIINRNRFLDGFLGKESN
jgi:hypothetical protein